MDDHVDARSKTGWRGRKPDDQVALLLAKGTSIERTASLAGVSARTIYRRLANPEFAA